MDLLKTYYNESADDFMKSKPITINEIGALVGKAYPRTINPVNIAKGFVSTWIHPFDTSIFSDVDYLGSHVTDRPDPATSLFSENIIVRDYSKHVTIGELSYLPFYSSSVTSKKLLTVPKQLKPFPETIPIKSCDGRRPTKSRILNSAPIKRAFKTEYEK